MVLQLDQTYIATERQDQNSKSMMQDSDCYILMVQKKKKKNFKIFKISRQLFGVRIGDWNIYAFSTPAGLGRHPGLSMGPG
jgi:hypothetical protein